MNNYEGLLGWDTLEYNGKEYALPRFDLVDPVILCPESSRIPVPRNHQILKELNKPYDYEQFKIPRMPISLGLVPPATRPYFEYNSCPRVLDMPIKFPGGAVRLPRSYRHFAPLIQEIINYEITINPKCYDEYYAYLTIDQGMVKTDELLREAPCHVDGFQGDRWRPKVRCNHTYSVSNCIPTVYYPQSFNLDRLDPEVYDFFWEMNCQVADTDSDHAWTPLDWETTLMDGYTVHRGDEATHNQFRTFFRLSFEVRIFDRLGNAHNPLFLYDWNMVIRDIESLKLKPWRPSADPSLICFPWQDPLTKEALPKGAPKTKPQLKKL